jgi:hypothetical protein
MHSAREVKGGSVGLALIFALLCLSFQLAVWSLAIALLEGPQDSLSEAIIATLVALAWLLCCRSVST